MTVIYTQILGQSNGARFYEGLGDDVSGVDTLSSRLSEATSLDVSGAFYKGDNAVSLSKPGSSVDGDESNFASNLHWYYPDSDTAGEVILDKVEILKSQIQSIIDSGETDIEIKLGWSQGESRAVQNSSVADGAADAADWKAATYEAFDYIEAEIFAEFGLTIDWFMIKTALPDVDAALNGGTLPARVEDLLEATERLRAEQDNMIAERDNIHFGVDPDGVFTQHATGDAESYSDKWHYAGEAYEALGIELAHSIAVEMGYDITDFNSAFNAPTSGEFVGGDADDYVIAGSSVDNITGGVGGDTILAGAGADNIEGNAGRDSILGEEGDDIISGGSDSDTVHGGEGFDSIYGGDGMVDPTDSGDYISGGEGDDLLYGNGGDDYIAGGEGNDTLYGGLGDDTLEGGAGDDVYFHNVKGGEVTINDSEGDNIINFTYLSSSDVSFSSDGDDWIFNWGNGHSLTVTNASTSGITQVSFDDVELEQEALHAEFDDWEYITSVDLVGGDEDDTLTGIFGDDTLQGLGGDDTLDGGEGNDAIDGGEGADVLYAGAGNDTLTGGEGDDFIYAESGDNRLIGGEGSDKLYGGEGADTFVFENISESVRSDSGWSSIFDFEVGVDQVDLSALDFTGLRTDAGMEGLLRVSYSAGSDRTYVRDDYGSDFEFYFDGDVTATLSAADFIFA